MIVHSLVVSTDNYKKNLVFSFAVITKSKINFEVYNPVQVRYCLFGALKLTTYLSCSCDSNKSYFTSFTFILQNTLAAFVV